MKHTPEIKTAFAARIRGIAVDLDGTILLPDASISERTVRTLKACMGRGLPILFSTGRSPIATVQYAEILGVSGPMVFYNGAAIVNVPDWKVLHTTPVASSVVAGCLQIGRKNDVHFQGFLLGNRLVFEKDRPECDIYFQRTGLHGEFVNFDKILSDGGVFYKCMFIADSAILDDTERDVDKLFGDTVYRTRSHHNMLEIMAPGISKGASLVRALSMRGISADDVIAFGDAGNDIPMLQAAGFGVAMGNAIQSVKDSAADVALPNTEDGVAAYLESLLGL